MANNSVTFKASYILKDEIKSKMFNDPDEAIAAFEQIAAKKPYLPRKLESLVGKTSIILDVANWSHKSEKLANKQLWLEDAEDRMIRAGVTHPQAKSVLEMPIDVLRNAVVARNVAKFTEIKGIGEIIAKRIILALRHICSASEVKSMKNHEFIRVQLNNESTKPDEDLKRDYIRKSVSPVEAKAIALGGADAIIHVVSYIAEAKQDDVAGYFRSERLTKQVWPYIVQNGLMVDGHKYVPFGHGTNAAKECKTLWIREDIYAPMRKWAYAQTEPNWKTTVAKRFAYLVGLQSVSCRPTKIPFMPQDFCIFPSVVDTMRKNVTKEFLDGHEENIDNCELEVNRSDGYFMIDVPEEMVAELYNRMLLRGDDPEEADELLREFLNNNTANSYRASGCDGSDDRPVALKGCGDKHFRVHEFLRDNGVTKTPDGRDLSTVAIFVDETVIKTNIGENCAYKTFEDWCNAVAQNIDLSVCVQTHKKAKKNVSYQVIQSLAEASPETIETMAKDTVALVNNLHTVAGVSKAIGGGLGAALRKYPEIANVRNVSERINQTVETAVDHAFGGKLLKACYYAFITPDPVYILQGWFGLKRTGCLEEGEFHCGQIGYGKLATWRSPVMHPNSVRVVNNVTIKPEFAKYFKSEEFVIIMNSKDDIALAMDADFDGDHGFVSDNPAIIKAAEETLSVWNRLIVWETPKTPKIVVDRKAELEYFTRLTKRNELGLTVYGLNALLNQIEVDKRKNPVRNVPISVRGVNFKKFAANVLVDASKHGSANIKEPSESSACSFMMQPLAKAYRDAALEKLTNGQRPTKEQIAQKREKLNSLAKVSGNLRQLSVSTLNRLFVNYSDNIDRSTTIHDAPSEKFDFHKLMFNPEERYRGLTGLIRKGNMAVTAINGDTIRPDQGLFNALARRIEHDRREWYAEDHKDKQSKSFEETWRINALCEIQNFAEAMGRTLEDAYDVITWQMFKYTDEQYETMDGHLDFFRDMLWKTYWLLFDGIVKEVVEKDCIDDQNDAEDEFDDSDDVDDEYDN